MKIHNVSKSARLSWNKAMQFNAAIKYPTRYLEPGQSFSLTGDEEQRRRAYWASRKMAASTGNNYTATTKGDTLTVTCIG